MNIILIYFSIRYKGDWDKIYKALESKEKVEVRDIEILEKRIESEKWELITIIDDNYPEQLKQAYKPPFVLWLSGENKILNGKFICATGNFMNHIDKQRVRKFSPQITKSHTIVSGSYKGIDEEILNINKNGNLIVLANGIDSPMLNNKIKNNDLLITEFPPGSIVTKSSLRNRNRIIAAFATSLILFTSLKNGPINNLITNFLNLGKDVYCFSGSGDEMDGNSELIKQGANLITNIKDISN